MGIALLRMMPNRPLLSVAGYSFLFAISSPIGIAIGIAIDSTTQGSTADWIYAIAMGFAAGVFIYVAINHLVLKGYVPDRKVAADRPVFKVIAFILGCGIMFVAMTWD
jgi:zinc transporter 1/2/3